MKTYKIYVDGNKTNDYIRGRISGMIYVLTGQPEMTYGWCTARGGVHLLTRVDVEAEQMEAIKNCINKVYPDAILLVKEVE